MSKNYTTPLWKIAPFVRLVLPLTLGIIFQWYLNVPLLINTVCIFLFIFLLLGFQYLSIEKRHSYQWVQGLLAIALIFCIAIFICWSNETKNINNWYGNSYTDSSTLIIKINEPPTEKEKSYKTEGLVEGIVVNGVFKKTDGKILIYFAKNDSDKIPNYGDKILINGGLQQIKNSGNPAAFNYGRYMAFQQTVHQVYLKKDKFYFLNEHTENPIFSFIFWARQKTIFTIQQYVIGNKKVTGIAEALLIGYKEDLDKDVVQAYSNTGVVHIIAISGMHLGLIYVGLVWLFGRLPFIKNSAILKVVLILSCLWLFSLITGASASVLRSAVMFSCIVIGKSFFKQASIYNSLAASAFLLLCYNPFLLWDVGFQLSYFAIVGIVWLQKPIQNLFYSKHKPLQYLWEMCSITMAAQILTLPICIYYFHQIPTTFLFTNLICVPLSTLILFAEIGLIICAFIPILASIIGKFIYVFTWLMNTIIDFFNKLPYALFDKIYATPFTTWLLYLFIVLLASALLRQKKFLLKLSLSTLLIFTIVWACGKIQLLNQKKIIVYNVSRHTAIDFVSKNTFWFYGDEEFREDAALQNFNLKPARVAMQVEENKDTLTTILNNGKLWEFYNKKIIILDKATEFELTAKPLEVDVMLICKNPKLSIAEINKAVRPVVIVFDGSNSLWKIKQWKKECEDLHLQYYDTSELGAFVLNVN